MNILGGPGEPLEWAKQILIYVHHVFTQTYLDAKWQKTLVESLWKNRQPGNVPVLGFLKA